MDWLHVAWHGRPVYDVALVLYLVLFFWLKAALLRRQTRLGWAMATVNIILGTLFLWSVVALPAAPVSLTPVAIALRLFLAAALTWAVVELIASRRCRDCL